LCPAAHGPSAVYAGLAPFRSAWPVQPQAGVRACSSSSILGMRTTSVAFLTGLWHLKICLDTGIEVGLSIHLRVKSLESFHSSSTEQPEVRGYQDYIVARWSHHRLSIQGRPQDKHVCTITR